MSDETKRPANEAESIESLPVQPLDENDASAVRGGIIVQGGIAPNVNQVGAGIISPDFAANTFINKK